MNPRSTNGILNWIKKVIEGPMEVRMVRGRHQMIPRLSSVPKWSQAQKENHGKFILAAQYGNYVKDDPELKLLYEKGINRRKNSAYMVAFTDYCTPPRIHELSTQDYTGAIGDPIHIKASDDFEVTKVIITITNAEGLLIEEGEAFHEKYYAWPWRYSAQVANPKRGGCVVRAVAFDRPGNCCEKEVRLMDW